MLFSRAEFIKYLKKDKRNIGYILEITGDINCYQLVGRQLVDVYSGQKFNLDDFYRYEEFYSDNFEELLQIKLPACIWQEHVNFGGLAL